MRESSIHIMPMNSSALVVRLQPGHKSSILSMLVTYGFSVAWSWCAFAFAFVGV